MVSALILKINFHLNLVLKRQFGDVESPLLMAIAVCEAEGLSPKSPCFLTNLMVFHQLPVKSLPLHFSHWTGNALGRSLEEQVFFHGFLKTPDSGLPLVKPCAQPASSPERGNACKSLVLSSPRSSLSPGGRSPFH